MPKTVRNLSICAWALALFLPIIFVSACASTKATSDKGTLPVQGTASASQKNAGNGEDGKVAEAETAMESITLPEVRVFGTRDPDLGLEYYDDNVLFTKGTQAFDSGDYDYAVRAFTRLLLEYGNSSHIEEARFLLGESLAQGGKCERAMEVFNAYKDKHPEGANIQKVLLIQGLCQVQLEKYDEAIALFDKTITEGKSTTPLSPEAIDAMFYRAFALMRLNRCDEAIAQHKELIEKYSGDLIKSAVMQSKVRIAICLMAKNDLVGAEQEIKSAESYYLVNQGVDEIEPQYGAEVYYNWGEIYRLLFKQIKLEYPNEVLSVRLEQKSQLLLNAQNRYIDAIKKKDPQWAAISGYRIGELYEELYKSVVETPVPPELVEQEGAIMAYHLLLKEKSVILLRKAIKIYEATLAMADRVSLSGEWINKTRASMEQVKELLLKEEEEIKLLHQEPEENGGEKEEDKELKENGKDS